MMFNSSFNQSYYAKHFIYLFQPLSRLLDFGLCLFCRLKNAPKAIENHPSSGKHMSSQKKGPSRPLNLKPLNTISLKPRNP